MAIDRTNYNALVDSNGTPGHGSVWDKAAIASVLLDPMDAALGSIHQISQGRLTLTSGVPITTADVTAATTVYFTPYAGNTVALYTGTAWVLKTLTEVSLSLSGVVATTPYDIFLYDNAGALTLERLAWATQTTRSTALVLQDGVYVKSGATTRRYLGTIFASANDQCEDSLQKRFVWNFYHRVPRPLERKDSTGSWTYTTAAWRQANGAAANQVEVIAGDPTPIDILVLVNGGNSAGGVNAAIGIGRDQTDPNVGLRGSSQFSAAAIGVLCSQYNGFVPLGYHFYRWSEFSNATGTTTWYGSGALNQAGISGWVAA